MVPHPCPGTGFAGERHRNMRAQADQRPDRMRQRIGFLRVAGSPVAYEPLRLGEAEAFSRRYPGFDPDGALAELRRREYARLDEGGQVYLDYTGGGLYAA